MTITGIPRGIMQGSIVLAIGAATFVGTGLIVDKVRDEAQSSQRAELKSLNLPHDQFIKLDSMV